MTDAGVGGVHPDQQLLTVRRLVGNCLLHHPAGAVGLPQARPAAQPDPPVAAVCPQSLDLRVEPAALVVSAHLGWRTHQDTLGVGPQCWPLGK